MKGFARRYFTLYQSGLLSYAFEPGQPIRDQVYLHNAAISTSPGRKDIHVDSNIATFHIKCLSTEDFNSWMAAFRRFISLGIEAKRSATYRQTSSRQTSIQLNQNRRGLLLDEMGTTFQELEASILSLCLQFNPPRNLSLNKKTDKHSKESMFGLFRRRYLAHQQYPESNTPCQQDSGQQSLPESLQEVRNKFEALKAQYTALVKVMQSSLNDAGQTTPTRPSTVEEEQHADLLIPRTTSPTTRKSFRDSVATTASDSFVEWFDAVDEGPQEFILDVSSEPPSRILSADGETPTDTSSVDTDLEEPTAATSPVVESLPALPSQVHVVRRTQLPCLAPSDEGSLFTILKKNVGKDLSTIAFPVTFNEPLTMLQRAAEEVEYYNLLDEAALATEPISRMSYVAAFAISSYAHTRHRTGRKGFNPMLAETFEDVRMKFIAEKVRHNPLEIAYHAEGENWELSATTFGKTKFWGKSLEIIPLGTNRLKIGADVYVWKKPSSFVRNLMVGTKYLEHCGTMTIENTATGLRCAMEFKQNGYWGPTNVVTGTIHSTDGDVAAQLEGKWDDQVSQMLNASTFHVLWKISQFPKNAPECYGFTAYSITLNELTSDLTSYLPSTDSRYRPDVRALENGELDLAEEEKLRVEQMQRDRRNRGEECQPRWFKQVGDSEWQYKGGYWEARARKWKGENIRPLW
ncbi:hypothetical protein NLJ89_g4514 [Agrocybe chaxingu]|uniref:PH domain-containing protein n=1 Tax=Agrocybe chaxingu TaxID=84603 RepID=A0A9W8MXN2_9AGAR|nr:hypothetical protein NLJ89_g4514 [Agrocybe chaxingu]